MKNWKHTLVVGLWCVLAAGAFTMLGLAMQHKDQLQCKSVNVQISGDEANMFIDEQDVLRLVNAEDKIINKNMGDISLRNLEKKLRNNPWVASADLFFDKSGALNIDIEERTPIARLFTLNGQSFYIDSSGYKLPLSNKITARVPYFTSFAGNGNMFSAQDSVVIRDVINLARAIHADSFWSAQIAQVDIVAGNSFEIYPLIGNNIICFGTSDNIQGKFDALFSFYKEVLAKGGLNKYGRIDVRFKGQVVATTQKAVLASDSTRAMEVLNNTKAPAEVMSTTELNKVVSAAISQSTIDSVVLRQNGENEKASKIAASNKTGQSKPKAQMPKATITNNKILNN